RIATIMTDFTSFARVRADTREAVELSKVIANVEKVLTPLTRHSGAFIVELDALPKVQGDPSRLEQVFLNLIMNAMQALPEGRQGNEVRVRGETLSDGRVCVEVKDNGVG